MPRPTAIAELSCLQGADGTHEGHHPDGCLVSYQPGSALRVGRFDPLKRTLLIDTAAGGDTKTGEARTVVLPAVVAQELGAYVDRWSDWKPDALIFPGERGAMLNGGNFRRRGSVPPQSGPGSIMASG